LALVALRNAHHIGRVGTDGEMAIQERLEDFSWMQPEINGIVCHVTISPPIEPERPMLIVGAPERINFKIGNEHGIPFSEGA